MAAPRNSAAFIQSHEAEYAEIEAWYRQLLKDTPPPVYGEWEPVRIGPTWQHDGNGWVLPEATLGWGFMSWCGKWLNGKNRQPWKFTAEQARFNLWYFSLESNGDFRYHSAILQRLKGWGKDPEAATIAAGSLHAPIVFDHWEGDRPVGRDQPEAWTQIVAVAKDQTKNTLKLFPSLVSEDAQRFYGIQIGKENVWSDGDRRQIEAVTASPLAIEGGRPKQVIRSETQNWNASNAGHAMAGALEGNSAKAEIDSPARILDICNAYRPGEDSVGERARVAWEETQGEDATQVDFGVLLDSLEAPPSAPLTAEHAPEVIKCISGDAVWLDTRPNGRIIKSILNPSNPPSESRRKWYNQITGTEDAWAEPRWVDQCSRTEDSIEDGERIVMFGDGSKSGDCTGIVACRLSDGFMQTLHFQQPSKGEIVDRAAVNEAVAIAFDTYKVRAFWFDPSHAKANDAVEDDRFWWPMVDKWHQDYSRQLKLWPIKSGNYKHSVAFDMLKPGSQMMFQPAVSQLAEELENGTALHHGGSRLVQHMKNARRRDGRYGVSIGKESRSSKRKVDLAVCAVGARMLWRRWCLDNKIKGSGRVVVFS